jgi:hypothetical protein
MGATVIPFFAPVDISYRRLTLSAPKPHQSRSSGTSATQADQWEEVEQASSISVCLPVCVQRAALRTPPPIGRTLSRKRFAARLPGADSSPKISLGPFRKSFPVALGVGRAGTPYGQACTASSGQTSKTELNHIINKVILIGRLGKNAEVKTAQNKKDYVVLSVATNESWKNDKGKYDTRTRWHRVYAWGNLTNFAKTLQKGQLVSLEGGSSIARSSRMSRVRRSSTPSQRSTLPA